MKKQTTLFHWALNFFLAIVIFCNAEAGQLLGLQELTLHVSAIWPATGFALAALLLFGTRTWPGIFFGNLAHNLFHLLSSNPYSMIAAFTAIAISFGSLMQALVGNTLMRRFCSAKYFNTLRDVFFFLLFGGALSCLIASCIGIIALYLSGNLVHDMAWYTALTFWFGDLLGVYIFTPLLIVWSIERPRPHFSYFKKEIGCMGLAFLLLGYFICNSTAFLAYLFFPLSLWTAYRFQFYGASLSLFLSMITIVVLLALSNAVITPDYMAHFFLPLVGLLEVIAISSLLFAAAINELGLKNRR
jgi:integral membrane sensor domain MASE1